MGIKFQEKCVGPSNAVYSLLIKTYIPDRYMPLSFKPVQFPYTIFSETLVINYYLLFSSPVR